MLPVASLMLQEEIITYFIFLLTGKRPEDGNLQYFARKKTF